MKTTLKRLTLAFTTLWLTLAPTLAPGRDPIVYGTGPSFAFGGWDYDGTSLDLNQDGTPDFSFQAGSFLCTTDIPTSGCSMAFYVLALGTNAMLHYRSDVTMLRFSETVGSVTATNTTWDDPDYYSRTAGYYFSPRYGTQSYSGPVMTAGVGYVGVRFLAADGLHYGWVRLRASTGAEFGPTVVDWAYESRPNTPIRTGDISSSRRALQMVVNFPDGNSGSLIFTEGQLRCELMLNGKYNSAKLTRSLRGNVRPIADLGQPLISTTNYSSFFRDVKLNRSEMIHLLSTSVFVSVDGGRLVGKVRLRE